MIHKPKNVNCNVCTYSTNTEEKLRKHVFIKHANGEAESEQCDICFKSYKSLKRHKEEIHSSKLAEYKCNICKAKFSRKRVLDKHIKSHREGELLLKCEYC